MPAELTFDDLNVMLVRIFNNKLPPECLLKYVDDDKDLVCLENDGDIVHALSLSSELKLNIVVLEKGKNNKPSQVSSLDITNLNLSDKQDIKKYIDELKVKLDNLSILFAQSDKAEIAEFLPEVTKPTIKERTPSVVSHTSQQQPSVNNPPSNFQQGQYPPQQTQQQFQPPHPSQSHRSEQQQQQQTHSYQYGPQSYQPTLHSHSYIHTNLPASLAPPASPYHAQPPSHAQQLHHHQAPYIPPKQQFSGAPSPSQFSSSNRY